MTVADHRKKGLMFVYTSGCDVELMGIFIKSRTCEMFSKRQRWLLQLRIGFWKKKSCWFAVNFDIVLLPLSLSLIYSEKRRGADILGLGRIAPPWPGPTCQKGHLYSKTTEKIMFTFCLIHILIILIFNRNNK